MPSFWQMYITIGVVVEASLWSLRFKKYGRVYKNMEFFDLSESLSFHVIGFTLGSLAAPITIVLLPIAVMVMSFICFRDGRWKKIPVRIWNAI
jgi:hypothetical protein